MKLKKFEPGHVMMNELFPSDFGKLVNRFFNDDVSEVSAANRFFRPSTDIQETESHYELSLSLPGMKKEDIKIELNQNELVISGERKDKRAESNNKLHLNEIIYGKFSRRFYLPDHVDPEKIQASFEDGMLHISIAKAEAKKPKLIQVK